MVYVLPKLRIQDSWRFTSSLETLGFIRLIAYSTGHWVNTLLVKVTHD
jgi:hypothetical protein